MYMFIHIVINAFISYTIQYLKFSLSPKKHTCTIPENHHRLGSERACYFIENNPKSGSWADYQWKLKDNFQSKAAFMISFWASWPCSCTCGKRWNKPEMFSSAVASQCRSIQDIAVARCLHFLSW